ncbi:MAG: glycosyltransferase family A protein [Actinomycetota bacterium]
MTGSDRPDVSVVIPTRDRWELLSTHALPSAMCQEDVSLEIIVVDDGSSDATADGLAAVTNPQVRTIRHERPKGVSAARNSGIAAARGTWIAFLDDDDLWAPWKLSRQLAAAEAGAAGWVYAAAIVVDEATRPLYALPLPSASAVAAELQGGNVVPAGPSNIVARADLVRQLGGFDETLSQGEDWDVWLLLAGSGPPVVYPEVLVATLSHGERSIHRYRPDAMREIERMLAKHRPVTRQDRLGTAQWLADQHHRGGRRYRAAATYLRAAVLYRSPGNLPPAAGALFGARGMRLASRLLLAVRGASHVDEQHRLVESEPAWLEGYRKT